MQDLQAGDIVELPSGEMWQVERFDGYFVAVNRPGSNRHTRTASTVRRVARTRLERVAIGWEPDPYDMHTRSPKEYMLPINSIDDVPDLGRRMITRPNFDCLPNRPETFWVRCLENDHAPKPLMVDDPSGDDVCADAPGAAEYMKG